MAIVVTANRLSRAEILRLPECGKFDAQFTENSRHRRLGGAVIATFKSTPIDVCRMNCIKFRQCKTFNFLADQNLCELNSKTAREPGVSFESRKGWLHGDTPVNQTKVQ